MTFTLHQKLAEDTLPVAELGLSSLLLMNDARFPWCIVVPRIAGLRDLHEVPEASKHQLLAEIDAVAAALQALTGAYKMNVAALGNMVEQLHVHVIARQQGDAAWPGPVWGVGEPVTYEAQEADALVGALRAALDAPP